MKKAQNMTKILGGHDKEGIKNFADNMSSMTHQLVTYDKTIAENLKISDAQLTILRVIERCTAATAANIAQYCQLRAQSVAPVIQQLEHLRLVNRVVDTSDRRAIRVSITASGRDLLEKDRAMRAQWFHDMMIKNCTSVEAQLLFLAGEIFVRYANE